MAGYNRRNTGRPKLWQARIQRRRESLNESLRAAETNSARIGIAAGYLMGATKHAAAGLADAATERTVNYLIGEADKLLGRGGEK